MRSSLWVPQALLRQYHNHRARTLSRSVRRQHSNDTNNGGNATKVVVFKYGDGAAKRVEARVGETLLQTAHRHDIPLEGACEGVCACSTCHLILPDSLYSILPEGSEDEEDMLDMAFGLTSTSRLGCQITVSHHWADPYEIQVPKATRNFYVDGHVPVPH